MAKRCVLGIYVSNRVERIPEIQSILTEYACYIKTRVGLHEITDNLCSPSGLIILEIHGGSDAMSALESKLMNIKGLQVQKMVFDA